MAGAMVPMAKEDGAFSGVYPGFIFQPSDEVLVDFYLRRKAADEQFLEETIPVLDLFGRQALPPWLLHPVSAATLTSSSSSSWIGGGGFAPSKVTDWFYCFARTSPRGSGSCRTTGCGTWLTSGGYKPVTTGSAEGESTGVTTLGYKSTLAFKIPDCGGGSKSTSWVMHEFKLHHGGGHPEARRKAAAASTSKKRKKNEGGHDHHLSEEEEEKHQVEAAPAHELVLCKIRCTRPMNPSELIMFNSQKLGCGSPPSSILQPADHDDEVRRAQKKQRSEGSSDGVLQLIPSLQQVAAPTTPEQQQQVPAAGTLRTNPVEQQQQVPAAAGTLMNSSAETAASSSLDDDVDLDGISIEDMAEVWQMFMVDGTFPDLP